MDGNNYSKYKYLLVDGKLDLISNNPDKYVRLNISDSSYMIPVSMPRRNPTLQFDLDNPDEKLWSYLADCEIKLSNDAVDRWKKEELNKLGSPSNVTDNLLLKLLNEHQVCYKCFSKHVANPNPQKNIQYLRDRGYIICTYKTECDVCGDTETTYSLTPILSCAKQSYETISKKLKEKICRVFDYTDSYTGIRNTEISAHIPDHKFPEDRWDENTPADNSINMTEEEIRQKFQMLNPQTNMQKQRFCGKCIKSKKRGYPFGIKYYYKGTEDWDTSIQEKGSAAEEGCVGCGWYDIEKWRKQLNIFLSQKEEER